MSASASVERSRLLGALAAVGSCSETKSTIPILSHARLSPAKGGIEVSATDLDAWPTILVPATSGSLERSVVVPLKPFERAARKLSGVILSIGTDQSSAVLSSNGTSVSLTGWERGDWPQSPEGEFRSVATVGAQDLASAICAVRHCVCADASRFQLNGGLLEFGEGCVRLVATDGFRLGVRSFPVSVSHGTDSILLPASSMEFLLKDGLLGGSYEISVSDTHIRFRGSRGWLTSRILEGAFPKYQDVIDAALKGRKKFVVMERRPLLSALQRLGGIAPRRSRMASSLSLEKGSLSIQCTNPNLGSWTESVPVISREGRLEKTGANPYFLADALKAVPSDAVRLSWQDKDSAVVVESPAAYNDLCLIMPMRLSS